VSVGQRPRVGLSKKKPPRLPGAALISRSGVRQNAADKVQFAAFFRDAAATDGYFFFAGLAAFLSAMAAWAAARRATGTRKGEQLT
jgi:hypothetical protein